jgi:hypothetical protein
MNNTQQQRSGLFRIAVTGASGWGLIHPALKVFPSRRA